MKQRNSAKNVVSPEASHKRYRLILHIVTFAMGGVGIAYEYTLSKIASDLLGNSVQQWAIVIGIMMLCMGIGSDLQKHIEDRKVFDRFVQFELLLGMMGGLGPLLLLLAFGAWRDYFALLQYALIVTIGLCIGMEIPLLARINQTYTPSLKVNIGGILRMDYLGAFAGALVWIFILSRALSLIEMGFVLGCVNIGVAFICFFYFYPEGTKKNVIAVILLICLTGLAIGGFKAPAWSAHAEQYLFRDKIILSQTTPYQHLVMTRKPTGELFFYINGNLQFASIDEFIYHECLVHPAMLVAPVKKRVLILGGGDGLAVREIVKHPDVESITIVDIDPAMTDLARNNPYFLELNKRSLNDSRVEIIPNKAIKKGKTRPLWIRDKRYFAAQLEDSVAQVSIINMDAAQFLAQAQGIYDVVIIDFPDPSTIELSKLYSLSFYRNLVSKLSRNGVVVIQSSSPFVVRNAYCCIGETLRAAGFSTVPFHETIPTFGDWGFWLAGHENDYTEDQLRQSMRAIDTIPLPVRYLTPQRIDATLAFGKSVLECTVDTNTILNNALFNYYRKGTDF